MHTYYEWDEKKDTENKRKHGVSFKLARYSFIDLRSIIA